MKDFLKRFWPWKQISVLEQELKRISAVIEDHKSNHAIVLVQLNDEKAAHSETKQHLKAARDAHTGSQNDMRRLVNIVAMKHGIK